MRTLAPQEVFGGKGSVSPDPPPQSLCIGKGTGNVQPCPRGLAGKATGEPKAPSEGGGAESPGGGEGGERGTKQGGGVRTSSADATRNRACQSRNSYICVTSAEETLRVYPPSPHFHLV